MTPIPLPEPDQPLIVWMAQNPDALRNGIGFLNRVSTLQVKLITSGLVSFNQQGSIIDSEQNAMLPLPILWQGGVPDNLAGGATLADVIVALNRVLTAERLWQSQPGVPT